MERLASLFGLPLEVRPVIFLGFGGNLGDPAALFAQAVKRLAEFGVPTLRRSSFYRTPPVGPPQPEYTNAAIEVATTTPPEELLSVILRVEVALGRQRKIRWGPRTLDIDLLLFGDEQRALPGLTVPHPRLEARAFVLVPLAEIAPAARHPVLGKTVAQLLAALPPEAIAAIRRMDTAWPAD